MIYLILALHAEAKPIIDYFSLQKDMAFRGHEVFRRDKISLLVTGIGKVKAAIGTTRLLRDSNGKGLCVNIGICGAPKNYVLGELLLANKIKDIATGRSFYSDILVKHGLNETSLVTHDNPVFVSEGEMLPSEPVDMEAAGFFEAASFFLTPDRIFSLKIVSDHFDKSAISKERVIKLIEGKISQISHFLNLLAGFLGEERELLSDTDKARLKETAARLKLTKSQNHILEEAFTAYKVKHAGASKILDGFLHLAPKTSEERRKIFENLKNSLARISHHSVRNPD